MSECKLLKGIVIGAISGALISMIDKKTRNHTVECLLKAKDTISYYSQNRNELKEIIETQMTNVKQLYTKTTENINLIVETIESLKELPESVQNVVNNTKSAITQKNSN